MQMTDYSTPAPAHVEALIASVFEMAPEVRYIAVCEGRDVTMRLAQGTRTDTTPVSNYFEELLVNPTILVLTDHRGALDCGGTRYVVVGYGAFVQFITRTAQGTLSVALSKKTSPEDFYARLVPLLEAQGMAQA